jgi:uncharacterized protein (UPF0128 family)
MKITKKELKEIIHEVATELGLLEGLTAGQEKLPEPLKAAILKKQEADGDDDGGDAEDEAIEEGNAFGDAVRKARELGLEEFEVNGKKYPVKEKVTEVTEDTEEFTGESDDDEVEEGNAFGDAVRKAKADGEDEFEVDGKTYQVTELDTDDEVEEGNAFGDAVRKAKADGEDEFEVDGKTYQVTEMESRRLKNTTLSETLARITGNKKIL